MFIGYQVMLTVTLFLAVARLRRPHRPRDVLFLFGLILLPSSAGGSRRSSSTGAVSDRFKQIDRSLPGLIDLLVVAVEAGMGFVAALRLTREGARGPTRAGAAADVAGADDGSHHGRGARGDAEARRHAGIRAFVRAIVQGETLGVSIGTILRNLADQMRKKRKAAAEEKAQKAPVKMLFPLVFLIFPALFVVILLPAIISIANTLGG